MSSPLVTPTQEVVETEPNSTTDAYTTPPAPVKKSSIKRAPEGMFLERWC
jgi:hypothetical protein